MSAGKDRVDVLTREQNLLTPTEFPLRSGRRFGLAAIAVAASLLLSGCGKDPAATSDAKDTTPTKKLTGTIFITGSSTVEPISTAVGEEFGAKYSVVPDVEGPGTGDGFKKFCAGEADIALVFGEVAHELFAGIGRPSTSRKLVRKISWRWTSACSAPWAAAWDSVPVTSHRMAMFSPLVTSSRSAQNRSCSSVQG